MEHKNEVHYHGGFLLTQNADETVDGFSKREVFEGFFLHSHPDLKSEVFSGSASTVLVLGECFDSNEPKGEKGKKFLETLNGGRQQFEDYLQFLAGRFVLLVVAEGQLTIYHDAFGTRTVYYSPDSMHVASHFWLLQKILNGNLDRDWNQSRMAMDLTMSNSIRQLLPNFALDCPSMTVNRYFPREENEFETWEHTQRMAEVERLWKNTLDGFMSKWPRVAMSITGGIDSRLSLAMAKEHIPDIEFFTYGVAESSGSSYSNSMKLDYEISQKLIGLLEGVKYKFFNLLDNPRTSKKTLEFIGENSVLRHGPSLVQRYLEEFPERDWLHLRSVAMEVFRLYWGSDSSVDAINRTCRFDGAIDFEDRSVGLGYDGDFFGYNGKDLLYWELRIGKWCAEVLNENDIAFQTLMPHATRRIAMLLLAYHPDERREGFAVKELINRNFPLLNFYGINSRCNIYEEFRDFKFNLNNVNEVGNGSSADAPSSVRCAIKNLAISLRHSMHWRVRKLFRMGELR